VTAGTNIADKRFNLRSSASAALGRGGILATLSVEKDFPRMSNLVRVVMVASLVVLLQGCTAASNLVDNNCSGTGWMHPGEDYCSAYVKGG